MIPILIFMALAAAFGWALYTVVTGPARRRKKATARRLAQRKYPDTWEGAAAAWRDAAAEWDKVTRLYK